MLQAPYHHKREIGSLMSITKKATLYDTVHQKCPEIKEIKLPAVEGKRESELTVPFDAKQKENASKSRPEIANVDELRAGILRALREQQSLKVECQVEGMLKAAGHRWIWTPPYCPW